MKYYIRYIRDISTDRYGPDILYKHDGGVLEYYSCRRKCWTTSKYSLTKLKKVKHLKYISEDVVMMAIMEYETLTKPGIPPILVEEHNKKDWSDHRFKVISTQY